MSVQRLAYHYAQISLSNYECIGCFTCSYEITDPDFIRIPSYRSEYVGKYYNPVDGLFYYEPEYVTVFQP